MSPRNHTVPLVESQCYVIDSTNPRGALDNGIEDRLHVCWRAADDAEHLRRRRLMLQRLAQFCVALAEFAKEAHVLNRDHGLVGESFEESDLLVGEWTDFRSADMNRSDRESFAKQWRDQNSADAA